MNRLLSFCLGLAVIGPLPSVEAQSAPAGTPNVLWIMLDDARADSLSCYGQPWARTPHMDSIAARGVRFETAIVQNMVCQPSRHSMLTGNYCHRVRHMGMGPPAENPPRYFRGEAAQVNLDLPKALASLGMAPLSVGKHHWGEWRNIEYRNRPATSTHSTSAKTYTSVQLTAPQKYPPATARGTRRWKIGGTEDVAPEDSRPARITDAALSTLKALTAQPKPFFLRVSYHAPHIPIQVPAEFMIDPASVKLPLPSQEELAQKPFFERHHLSQYSGTLHLKPHELQVSRGTYYGMVAQVDHEVGRLLDFLREAGDLDNTIIVINSDHGLQLGEHGIHKKRNFYEQTVAVPFIFSWPGHLPEGQVIEEPVEMIDFLPTLYELLGVPVPEGIDGRSMLPLIRGEVKEWRPAVFSEIDHAESYYTCLRAYTGRRIMVRTKEWKMIYFRDERAADSEGALYHLKTDPGETRNLYEDEAHADVRKELEALVDAWDS